MFNPNLHLKLKAMPMPLMVQSLTLLGMDSDALNEYIQSAVSSNPLLEYPENSHDDSHTRMIYSLPAENRSLYTCLNEQLHMLPDISSLQLSAAEFIIGNLDEDGYLRSSLRDLALDSRFSKVDLESALELVQSLDPPGIGARNLQECLLLQIKRMPQPDLCAFEIVQNHLEELARGMHSLDGYSAEQLHSAIALIRSLSPRPGHDVSSSSVPEICIPELEIILNEYGRPEARLLNAYEIPVFSPLYHESYLQVQDPAFSAFVRSQAADARLLLYAIQRRRNTLLAIGNCIAERQSDFFSGRDSIHSLRILDIARDLSLHSSTVSRGMQHKYLLFNGKTYPLHHFLSARLASGHSPEQIKARIRELLKQFPHKKPSDQKIADILRSEGIQIARRTVNKYRLALQKDHRK